MDGTELVWCLFPRVDHSWVDSFAYFVDSVLRAFVIFILSSFLPALTNV